MNLDVTARARNVRLLLMDCDGVLTDGRILYTFDGERVIEATKVFHIHDGQGLRLASQAGIKLGIITGRTSHSLIHRANEMQVDYLYQSVSNKLTVYEQLKLTGGFSDKEIAYIGDDLPDIAPMRRSGLAVSVADAVLEVRNCAHYVTEKNGGDGAVREIIEIILKAQGKWDVVLDRFNR